MEISWTLIINHINCLNLLNLQNYSIFQGINRGLGEDINRINIGEQSYAGGISSEILEQQNSESFGCRGVLGVRRWVVLLSHSLIVNKENSCSNIVLSLFHVSWLMNIFDYALDILFI